MSTSSPSHTETTNPRAAMSSSRRVSSQNVRSTRPRSGSSLGDDPRGDTGGTSMATSNWKSPTPPTEQQPIPGTKERGRKRKKAKNLLRRTKRLALKHTWLIPLVLMSTILALYFISPGEHNPLHAAIYLSYPNPPLNERTDTLPAHIGNVTQYGKGPKDFAFVAFYIIVLSFTREFLMQRLIRPVATKLGIRGRDKMARFMEQAYTAIYFAIFGPFGLFVMSRTPVWYFNTVGMYEGFPHRAHEAYFKAYYLLQASYWAQQAIVLVLLLEKPRKDFKELVIHHIITLALIGLSYRFHFTYMGVAVYITHDISDFFLATSKCLNYLDSIITGPYYVMFMFIWAYLRHYINLRLIYSLFPYHIPGLSSLLGEPNTFKTVGPYATKWSDVDFPNQQYKCYVSQPITFSLLASLQAVNLFWFFLICRIFCRYAFKGVTKDERSDDEYEDDEVEEVPSQGEKQKQQFPDVLINGLPAEEVLPETNGHVNGGLKGSTGMETQDRKATLRKR